MNKVIFFGSVILFAIPASSIAGSLGNPNKQRITTVWKSLEDRAIGRKLLAAGVMEQNEDLIFDRMSCLVRPGTKAVEIEKYAGFKGSYIVVTSGKHTGCEGVVDLLDYRD